MKLEEAIEILKSYENKLVYEISEKDKEAVSVVLNHLTKQEKRIKKVHEQYKKLTKQYFEKKAEENK